MKTIMKAKFVTLLLAFCVPNAHATGGIDCTSADGGTIKLFTEEAISQGDNVLNLGLTVPWIKPDPIHFERSKGEVNVTRDEQTIYVASNSKGESVTLLLDIAKKSGKSVSQAIVRADGKIYSEILFCE